VTRERIRQIEAKALRKCAIRPDPEAGGLPGQRLKKTQTRKDTHRQRPDRRSMSSSIKQIVKRDGTVVPYERDRIATAIFKAAAAVGGSDRSKRIALPCGRAASRGQLRRQSTPSVERSRIWSRKP
jgi:hypothetical protein